MFKNFNLAPQVLKAIEKMNFVTPTPVQEKTIPAVMQNRDVISLAETGSGKTIAYLAPTLSQVLSQPNKQVLILAPTRELATQIGTVIRDLSCFSPNTGSVVLIGGAAMSQQVRGLKKNPRFLIATPGRLMDHVRQRTADLSKITHFILDEADRMFDMGFAPQVNAIVRMIPRERQTMLFSATFPKEIRGLAEQILKSPIEIEVRTSERPPIVIEQKMIQVETAQKNDKTLDLINEAKGSVVIFTRTKSRTDRLTKYLEEYGVKVARIHGDRSQGQRNKSISDFKAGLVNVLVATDIAARGLDVPGISDVINYDLPQNAEDYVHRIGRTGRAGQTGQSLTLVTREDESNWNYIARKMGLPLIGKPAGGEYKQYRPHGTGRPQQRGGGGAGGRGKQPQRHGKSHGGGGGKPHSGGSKPHSRGSAGGHKKSNARQDRPSW
jgi:ATP-dependent RNA helicase RhlE